MLSRINLFTYRKELKRSWEGFDGNNGLLNRKHLFINDIIHIGKESNKLEESFYFGVQENNYETYIPENKIREIINKFISKISLKIALKYSISKRTYMYLRYKAKNNISFRISNKIQYKLNLIRKYEKIN